MIKYPAGAPPAPPPPPPGFAGARRIGPMAPVAATEPAAPAVRVPSKPMTKLWWQKLPLSQVEHTVWSELDPLKISVDFAALEANFAARDAPKVSQILTDKRREVVRVVAHTW
jgi:hypothetical protein